MLWVCGHEHFAMGPVCHLCYKADASHEQCRFGPILRAWQRLRLVTEHGFWELVCFSVEYCDAVRGVFFSVASPAGRCATSSRSSRSGSGICMARTGPLPAVVRAP
jgi:hypothetical protein